jgi:cytoskeletal protein CcmA (bactofilin family)
MRGLLVLAAGALIAVSASGEVSFDWNFDEVVSGGYAVIPAGESYEGNIGVFGGYCEINGNVNGDLTVFGGDVRINGNVTGDVLAGGGNVIVAGNCAGETAAFGGSVSLPGNFVGRTKTGGGSVSLPGNFTGPVEADGGAVFLKGNFLGPVEAEGEKVFVEPGASLNAGLSYSGELVQDPSARVEGPVKVIEYEEPEAKPEKKPSLISKVITWLLWRVGEFLALMLFSFLIWLARPGWLQALPEKMRDKPWQTPLAGLIFVTALDVLIIVLFITIIGIPSALVVTALSLVFLYASWVFVAACIGNTILKPIFKEKKYPVLFATALGASILILITNLLWLIPFCIGCVLYLLVCFGVIWYGFGAGLLHWWSLTKARTA